MLEFYRISVYNLTMKSLLVKFCLILLKPIILIKKITIIYTWPSSIIRPTTIDFVRNRALESSAQYIEQNINKAMLFSDRKQLWSYAISKVNLSGIYAEFGVSFGKSMKHFSNVVSKGVIIHGFDSFEGLREDFIGTNWVTGAFTTSGKIPNFEPNVNLHVGWFHETLPNFLESYSEDFAFIHLDADTYESTYLVLNLLKNRIKSGTIIVFDEYIGIPNWKNGEHKAWTEFMQETNKAYEYLAFSDQAAVVKVL